MMKKYKKNGNRKFSTSCLPAPRRILVLIAYLFLFSGMYAQNENNYTPVKDPSMVNTRVSAASEKMKTLKADFIQEKHMDFLQMDIISEGKFWFKKENQLRWEYTDPYSYIIVINDNKITIDDEGRETEFKVEGNKIFQQVNDIIVTAVSGNIMNDNDYNTEVFENPSHYKIKLTPTSAEVQEVIKEMHLFLDKSTLTIAQVKMIEPTNDFTLIRFKNQKINEPIASGIFNLN